MTVVFTVPFLVIIVIILLIIYFYLNLYNKPENFPPGPPRLPIWGSYWFLVKENYYHPHLALENLSKRYKTDILGFYLGDIPAVATFNYDLSKELLTKEECLGRNDTVITRGRSLGELKGLFFVDGPLWKSQRRFSLRNLRDFGFGRRSQCVENFVTDEVRYLIDFLSREPENCDKDICRGKGIVLVPDFMYGSLLNTIFLILSSSRFDHIKLREIARTALKFQRSGDGTGSAISITPWLKHIAPEFFGYKDAMESNIHLIDFLQEVVEEQWKTFSNEHHRGLIDVYISIMQEEEGSDFWDQKQLLLVLLDYMFPSANAIGHTLQFLFCYLINNPRVQIGIQKEIDQVVGRSRLPNLDDRKSMPYVEASIKEALRILPLNPLGIARRCMEDTTIGGYFIPKDTILLPNVWAVHRSEKLWEKPLEFLPERFLDQEGNLLKSDLTIGFGAGKRLCAGETFARQNMFLMVSGLLQNFTLKSPNDVPIDIENLVPGMSLSLDNAWIQFVER